MKRFLSLMVIIFAAGVTLAKPSFVGAAAPDFALKNVDGKNLRLSEFVGEVVLINFGADWCGKCAQDRRGLDKLYNQYAGLGFVVLGVNMDKYPEDVSHMAREQGISFPMLFDDRKRVTKTYKVDKIPTTVLVDRDGNVRHVFSGYKNGEAVYQEELKALLKE